MGYQGLYGNNLETKRKLPHLSSPVPGSGTGVEVQRIVRFSCHVSWQ